MTRPLTADDLYAIKLVSDPQVAPDGSRIAYVQTEIARDTYEYLHTIWVVGSDGETPRRFTTGPNDSTPRWSPNGHSLAFVRAPASDVKPTSEEDSAHGIGKSQIWLMPTDGGEALKLTAAPYGASDPVWSPDGRTVVFAARTGQPDDREADDAAVEGRSVPRVRTITRLWHRLDSVGYTYDQRTHLFRMRSDGLGEAEQLTFGDYDDGEATFSPDGARLAFTSDRSAERWVWPAASVWVLDVARGALTRVSDEALGASAPAWSLDGSMLAFLTQPRRHGNGHTDLYVAPADGTGAARLLTQEFTPTCADMCLDDVRTSHTAGHLIWSADGRDIFLLASMRGTTHVYAAPAQGDLLPRRITEGDCRVYAFSCDRQSRTLALALATPLIPGDIYAQQLPAAATAPAPAPRRLTAVNRALLAERELATPQEIPFKGADGWDLQGWVLRPPQVGAGEQTVVPAVLEVHGGPSSMYGATFMFEFQLLAARGYAVIYSNPRGSTGYGRTFAGAVINDWGGKDFEDIMAGLDAAIANGGIDPRRLGIAGGSYGGFITNWAIGHTDRFQAAVTMRSVVNMATMFGTSDLGWGLVVDELDATPWGDPQRLARFSPITYVSAIHTPLLILHAEQDLRCPISEAEQLFSALTYLGRETELVRFAGQSHELSRGGHPRSRVIRLNKILDWVARYVPTGQAGGSRQDRAPAQV